MISEHNVLPSFRQLQENGLSYTINSTKRVEIPSEIFKELESVNASANCMLNGKGKHSVIQSCMQ